MKHKTTFKFWLVSHVLLCFMLGLWYGIANAGIICSDESSKSTYVGIGETKLLAQANMWENCVDQLVAQYENVRGKLPSDERHILFINSCINRKCTTVEEEK